LIVRVICGPTGGGKSALALRLASRHNAAIISADSRQVYRGFDIGTAKPSEAERASVPHFGIDVIAPGERYSAARWAAGAREWMEAAGNSGRVPVVVGGTGLYIKALFEPLSPIPSLDPKRRAELDEFLNARATDELRSWCRLLDAPRSHLGRTQLIRAIETALLSGERLSESLGSGSQEKGGAEVSQSDSAATRARGSESAGAPKAQRGQAPETSVPTGSSHLLELTPVYLLVDPMNSLHRQIETRFDQMIERGWLDEVKHLDETIPETAPAWKASGYVALRDVVRGLSVLENARDRVIIETRQYAKRQRTWFRHQLLPARVTRLDPESSHAAALADSWWRQAGALA